MPVSHACIARLCMASILAAHLAAPDSMQPPLSRTDVLGLVASSATPQYTVHVVQQRGLSFRATDEYIQMVRRASVSAGLDDLEQILKAASSTRSEQAGFEKEAAVLPHVARCGELQHARSATGFGRSQSALTEAETECRAAVKLSPPNVFLLLALGSALREINPQAAIAVFREAIALEPGLSEAHLLLADALTSKGTDRNAGVREALDALRLDPNNPDGFMFFLFLFGDAGVRDAELSMLLEETAKHPNDAAAHWVLGWAYLEGKQDQGNALRNIREAVRLDQNNAWYHFYLSGLLRSSGDIVGATAEGEIARKLDPSNRMFRAH